MKKTPWLIAVLLAGCAGPPEDVETPTGVHVSNGAGSADAFDVTTKGGTRCVVLVGSAGAALSCDWSKP